MTFAKILIANRGEIAVRINRTAQALGYRTVAVFSDVDAGALHVQEADEAVLLGPAPVTESYLHVAKIVDACRVTGADAVHPGYGLLAENADFADALLDAGIAFIGPSADAIRAMGDKAAAKRLMLAAGVPCVPGYHDMDQTDERLSKEADQIGFPIMVKAVAGGGGRGMRLVETADQLSQALASARSEAHSAFGSAALLLERAVIRPRHIEVQIVADQVGNVIHLGERDCSIQRRHQKVFEESPSPTVAPTVRAALADAAILAARAIDYWGMGTVEFLYTDEPDVGPEFYFLEMNTRLQVEHPVTEMITGLDLVAWQIAIAEGRSLPLAQEQIIFTGHAIEARLCAEDPAQDFAPQTGTIETWLPATGPGLRIDSGIIEGDSVSPFYDSMLAKVIAHGATREDALRNLTSALERTQIFGLRTNRRFLLDCLRQDAFVAGTATTAFVGETFGATGYSEPELQQTLTCLAALLLIRTGDAHWPRTLSGFSSSFPIATPLALAVNSRTPLSVHVSQLAEDNYRIDLGANSKTFQIHDCAAPHLIFECDDGIRQSAFFARRGEVLFLSAAADAVTVRDALLDPPDSSFEIGSGKILAPMDGVVVAVHIELSETVRKGDLLLVLEAMKMEQRIVADVGGEVIALSAQAGTQVATKQLLVEIDPEPDGD